MDQTREPPCDGVGSSRPGIRPPAGTSAVWVERWIAAGAESAEVVAEVRGGARDARQRGVRAEQLVIAIRTAWQNAAPAPLASTLLGHDARLTRLVELALDAYFADPG